MEGGYEMRFFGRVTINQPPFRRPWIYLLLSEEDYIIFTTEDEKTEDGTFPKDYEGEIK